MTLISKEKELAGDLKNSEYTEEFILLKDKKKKKEIIKILIDYLSIKNSLGLAPSPSRVFDVVCIFILEKRQEMRRFGGKIPQMDIKNVKTNTENIKDYIFKVLDMLEEETYEEKKFFLGLGNINFSKFEKELQKLQIKESKKENFHIPPIKGHQNTEKIFLEKKFKSKAIYNNVDKDEIEKSIPPSLLECNEDEMEKLKKKIVDFSLKEGKFKADSLIKGNKVEEVNSTRNIEDFSDFLSSSFAYIKKNKKLFAKQLLEKEVLKLEKPLRVQSNKRYKFDFYLENSPKSQEIIEDRKIIYYFKVLSMILISDLAYIFSDIRHWKLNVTHNYIPVIKETGIEENVHLMNVERIVDSLERFIDVENFIELYVYERANFRKFIFNTVNYGDSITKNLKILEEKHLEMMKDKGSFLKKDKKFSVFLLVSGSKAEKDKKMNEIKNEKTLENYCAIILNLESNKISLEGQLNKEYSLKEGYKDLRTDFLKIMVEFFGG